jgi:hypothetical protein
MPGRYDQSDLNTYGAEDDDEMDSILAPVERANDALPGPVALLSAWSDWKQTTKRKTGQICCCSACGATPRAASSDGPPWQARPKARP